LPETYSTRSIVVMGADVSIDELLKRVRDRARAKGRTIDYLQNLIDELERELAERLRVNLGLSKENQTLRNENQKLRRHKQQLLAVSALDEEDLELDDDPSE
jgi:hypothetical protein